MTPTTTDAALAYYASIGAALFPVPAGQKNPTGIVSSFVTDCSTSPEQWAAWRSAHPNCNFGLVAGHSRLIIVDIDAADFGRDEAWEAYKKLCMDEWHLSCPPMPQCQSARGGWHALFQVPEGVDARSLRQPDARKGIINVRAGNGFVIAAGSYYDGTARGEQSGWYSLISDAPPHPAPAALIEHCTRLSNAPITKVGDYDPADVAELLRWMAERSMFDSYSEWTDAGMALRLEFGDAGLDLWRLTFVNDGKDKQEASHWQSFATDPRSGMMTLHSMFDRAHKEGWKGSVRPSLQSMFGDVLSGTHKTVADLAAQVGANLSSELMASAPGPDGESMFGRDEKRSEIAVPILEQFLTAYVTAPSRPSFSDFPTMPPECASLKLFAQLNDIIPRLYAVCELASGKGGNFNKDLVVQVFAVISMHSDKGGEAILRRAQRIEGFKVKDRAVNIACEALKTKVEAALHDDKIGFTRDRNLQIEKSFDNMCRLYEMLGIDVRFNEWLERIEVRGWEFGDKWRVFDDNAEIDVCMHASTKAIQFNFAVEFHWRAVNRIARKNKFDPAIDILATCQAEWDGVPRLSGWLSMACGVPDDPYHQMVGRSIIGGMVKRIRKPGCKHDEMAVFIGDQGTSKSTLARAICPDPDWFTDSVRLGDESKELVLSLAGRAVCEVSEMASRKQIEDVKAMLTKTSDLGRPAYARSVVDRKRRNIFIGSTNETTPLQDSTGNRRFLPVWLRHHINIEWVTANIRQLIGEAAQLESAGQTFAVPKELWEVAAEHQEAARSKESEEVMFADWFAQPSGFDASFVMCSDLEKLAIVAGFKSNKSRGQVMRQLGFRIEPARMFGKVQKIWIRGELTGRQLEASAVQFVVDVDAGRFPRVVVRLPGPELSAGQSGPPMPPVVPPLPMVPRP